ncbi:MAG: vWA domain-containing protein [Panacagrimonas sp.]
MKYSLAVALILVLSACSTPPESPGQSAHPAASQAKADNPHPINEVLGGQSEPKKTIPEPEQTRRIRVEQRLAEKTEADRARFAQAANPMSKRHALMASEAIAPGPIPVPPMYPSPPPVDREGYAAIAENRFLSTALSPLSTFGLDVDTASYSNMRRFINNGRLPPPDAIRIEELVNYFDYDFPQPDGGHPISVTSDYAVAPWNPDHRLAMIGVKAHDIRADARAPNRLVFLLDTSGSMSSHDKLPLLIQSFGHLVNQLGPQDRVAIVTYAGSAGLVLPSTSGANKGQILGALSRLSAGGSTAGGAGIQLAYQIARQQFAANANNRVIIGTDGDFNVGASSNGELVRMIEKEREHGVFLTVMGFGTGNYQDAKMQQLAGHGNGTHHYIDSAREAQRVLGAKLLSTLYTVAKDVKVQVEFNPAAVAQYRLIGYENRVMAAEDFRDDKKDSGDVGAGHTVVALYEIIPTGIEKAQDIERRYAQPGHGGSTAMELGYVKLRYKQPDSDAATEFDWVMNTRARTMENASANLQWAASVAELGLLLGDSDHKGKANFASLIARAESFAITGEVSEDQREFLQLARRAQTMSQTVSGVVRH